MSDIRYQKSEIRNKKPEIRNLISEFRRLLRHDYIYRFYELALKQSIETLEAGKATFKYRSLYNKTTGQRQTLPENCRRKYLKKLP
jgi:hypothetical protein